MYLVHLFVFLLVVSCQEPTDPSFSDTTLYLEASNSQPENALPICTQIKDIELRGDVYGLRRRALQNETIGLHNLNEFSNHLKCVSRRQQMVG